MLKLHGYFRSSASFRVRIALNLKGVPWASVPVALAGGEQLGEAFRALNPAGLVPVLQDGQRVLAQSLAIIEYLDETHPEPPLLPKGAFARAQVRALALSIACDIHPLNNLRVLKYLKRELGIDEERRNAWYRHWVEQGLGQLEGALQAARAGGPFCHGSAPTLADCCLVPQVFNAQRYDCRLDHVPTVMAIHAHCMTLEAFQRAAPAAQPDAE